MESACTCQRNQNHTRNIFLRLEAIPEVHVCVANNQSASFHPKGKHEQRNSPLGLIGSPGKLLRRAAIAVELASVVEPCTVVDRSVG